MSEPAVSPEPSPVSPDPVALIHQANRLARMSEPAWLNQEVARRLADKLAPIRLTPARWVEWFAHLGGGATLVQQAYPEAQHWAAEPLPSLQQRSQAALRGTEGFWRRLWGAGGERVWLEGSDQPPPWGGEGGDLIWANMCLHTRADLGAMFAAWHRQLAINGFLMCSGLGPDTARELRALYAEAGWGLPTIQFIDMHDLGDALVQAGFVDPVMDMERITLTWANADAMLAELRTWGGNVARGRFQGLRTPRWRERLCRAIDERLAGPDGRVALTVELVYGHAIKPAPRPVVSAETRVSLDDMRRMVRHSGKP